MCAGDTALDTREGQVQHYASVRLRLGFGQRHTSRPSVGIHVPLADPVPPEPRRKPRAVMVVPGFKLDATAAAAKILSNICETDRRILDAYREVAVVDRVRTMRAIAFEVCQAYKVPAIDLWASRRGQTLDTCRQEAYFRMRHETTMSLPAIGRRCGNRDHTTILHGVRRVTQMLATGWRMRTLPDVIGVDETGYVRL